MHYLLRRTKRVTLILPALTEATSPSWRPIKYSLFPPLGLATLAAYLDPSLEITLQDEHVEPLDLDDEPDLVIIQVYITNAYRAYRIADHYRSKGAPFLVSFATSPPALRSVVMGPACARSRDCRRSGAT